MSKLFVVVAAIIGCACLAAAQIAIPHRPLGFALGSNDAPVVLEIFIDSLCPDSKASWPTVTKVQQYYGNDKVKLIVHFSPLISERNSFNMDLASFVVAKYANSSAVFDWINVAFNNQASFWNTPTATMTASQVMSMIGSLAESNGFVSTATMLQGLADSSLQDALSTSAAYSVTRNVVSRPSFIVNNVAVAAEAGWQVSDWISVLDPLFAADFRRSVPSQKGDCPAGENACQYLPGKVQCCLPGEMCIPNVGCRC